MIFILYNHRIVHLHSTKNMYYFLSVLIFCILHVNSNAHLNEFLSLDLIGDRYVPSYSINTQPTPISSYMIPLSSGVTPPKIFESTTTFTSTPDFSTNIESSTITDMFPNKNGIGSTKTIHPIMKNECREICNEMNDPYLECGILGNSAKVQNCYNKMGTKRLECRRTCS
jgi:hypothetical protein